MPRPTARDIVDSVVQALRGAQEPLDEDLVLVPAVFDVMLHPAAYQELRSLLPRIRAQAIAKLDGELHRLNSRRAHPAVRYVRRILFPLYRFLFADRVSDTTQPVQNVRYERAGDSWQVDFIVTGDADAELSFLSVQSDFARARQPSLKGRPTINVQRRTTRLPNGRYETVITARRPAHPSAEGAPGRLPSTEVLARLVYEDRRGRHVYYMRKDEISIGRGDEGDAAVDVALETLADVSREHAFIRRSGDTGSFFIKNVGRYGATVNGGRVEAAEGEEWHPLPNQAEIGLADAVFLRFEKL